MPFFCAHSANASKSRSFLFQRVLSVCGFVFSALLRFEASMSNAIRNGRAAYIMVLPRLSSTSSSLVVAFLSSFIAYFFSNLVDFFILALKRIIRNVLQQKALIFNTDLQKCKKTLACISV